MLKFVIVALFLSTIEAAAFAQDSLPNQPPSGYYYAQRTYRNQLTALNGIKRDDGTITFVRTDIGANAVRLSNVQQDTDVYIEKVSENEAIFDIRSFGYGEFAGFTGAYQWTDQDGISYYFFEEEVNGLYHYMAFQTDSSGNPTQIENVKYKSRPDKCKVISDWGALQCPSQFNSIKEIPTRIQEMAKFQLAHWWNDAWNGVSSAAKTVVSDVKKVLADKDVQMALTVFGLVAADVGCCYISVGSACAYCVAGSVAIAGASYGQIYTTNTPEIRNTNNFLREQGTIACYQNHSCWTVTSIVIP